MGYDLRKFRPGGVGPRTSDWCLRFSLIAGIVRLTINVYIIITIIIMYSFNAVKSSERSGFYQAGVFIYHTAVQSVAVMKSRLLYWSCRLK